MKLLRTDKPCEQEGCGSYAVPGNRFCAPCRKIVLKEMRVAGYLQELEPPTRRSTGGVVTSPKPPRPQIIVDKF